MGDEAILGLCNRLMKSRDSVHSIREIKTGKHRSAITTIQPVNKTPEPVAQNPSQDLWTNGDGGKKASRAAFTSARFETTVKAMRVPRMRFSNPVRLPRLQSHGKPQVLETTLSASTLGTAAAIPMRGSGMCSELQVQGESNALFQDAVDSMIKITWKSIFRPSTPVRSFVFSASIQGVTRCIQPRRAVRGITDISIVVNQEFFIVNIANGASQEL
ncbi:hypothetical protein HO173_010586 [Letharia columbiana]|uniref:Uncharacterized protein n=1 Tax=Letharia columbiana TaxID=112416 RepID=A0A8H6L0R4_9LECA|nr:uncharacterized protein HO173_010586 [Letharia columbiana]KAF6231254.1 hypothetical protein HO173_010586 [Letharia columbiana]